MNLKARLQHAQSLFQQRRFDEARAAYEAVCRLAPRNGDAWNMLGALKGMLGDLEGAERCFLRGIKAAPKAAGIHINLGNTCFLRGDFVQAGKSYRQALALEPNNSEALVNLGNLLRKQGDLGQAEEHYRRALRHNPAYADAHSNLGVLLHENGRYDEAIGHYAQALRLQPQHFDARHNLVTTLLIKRDHANAEIHARGLVQVQPGNPKAWLDLATVHIQLKQYEHAMKALETAAGLEPDNAEICYNMGVVLKLQKRNDAAAVMLRKALELNPENASAAYLLSTIGAIPAPDQPPAGYVKSLFDDYAEIFDEDLVGKLEYDVPATLYRLTSKLLPEGNQLDILDLGCGTGLCGKLFRNHARHLAGVDLSPRMVDKARALGVYDRLVVGDLIEALSLPEPAYDLVLATDVFVYIGKLDEIFAACQQILRPAGLFAFSVEAEETGPDYVLRPSGRYGHSAAYIHRLAEQQGFAGLSNCQVTLRKEAGVPMPGNLFIFKTS